jgi:L-arabinose isomerase
MSSPTDATVRPVVGVLALTLEFYERSGPQIREGRQRWLTERALPALAPVADCRFEAACFRREDIERTVAGYEADGADCLLVICLTYATSLSALPALQRTRLPICVWNTQELRAVDASYDSAALTANHGVHGTFDLCNCLNRAAVPFAYVTSHLDDPAAVERLGATVRAAAAVSWLRRMRIGRLGWPFAGMGDFGVDTTHLAATLGCAWEALSVADFNRRAADADHAEVERLVADYRRRYEPADDVTGENLAAAARAEAALRGLVAEHRLDAVTYQFLAFGADERTETIPFVAASRLMAEGVGFGGEGDLISAAFATLLNRLQPPASFSEIFTIDFAGNSVLLSHMGEANVAMARRDGPVRLVKRSPIVPVRGAQLVLPVVFEPGEATLAVLTPAAGGRWRIIAAPVTLLDFGPLGHLHVPHAKARPATDVREFLTAYATAGGPHHLAVCFGDAREKLKTLAHLLGADYVEV